MSSIKEEQIKQLNALINLYKGQPENLEAKIWKWHSKIIDDKIEEMIKVLKEAEISCSGSCGAGCEFAVQDLINSLKT